MKPLLVIAAGGTIDAAEYNFETGSVIAFAKPAAIYVFEKAIYRIVLSATTLTGQIKTIAICGSMDFFRGNGLAFPSSMPAA